mgnify:CR=1 FL=1
MILDTSGRLLAMYALTSPLTRTELTQRIYSEGRRLVGTLAVPITELFATCGTAEAEALLVRCFVGDAPVVDGSLRQVLVYDAAGRDTDTEGLLSFSPSSFVLTANAVRRASPRVCTSARGDQRGSRGVARNFARALVASRDMERQLLFTPRVLWAALMVSYACRYTSSYLMLFHSRSTNTLSRQQPFPSMLIWMP